MSGFLGRRLIRAVLTVWAVATLVFLLMHALPGDVVLVLLDTVGAGSEAANKMRQFLGLDRPLYVQYFDWLGDLLRGDMGNSLLGGYPVWDLVKIAHPRDGGIECSHHSAGALDRPSPGNLSGCPQRDMG